MACCRREVRDGNVSGNLMKRLDAPSLSVEYLFPSGSLAVQLFLRPTV